MAVETPCIHDGSCSAATDLSGAKFRCVQISGSKLLTLCTSSTGQVFYGILQNTPRQGQQCDVAILGVCKVIAGAPITYGQQLMPDTNGAVVPWLSGNLALGVALESAIATQVLSALVVSALN
jgi:Uncharacterized conserved protein (DUF2190)